MLGLASIHLKSHICLIRLEGLVPVHSVQNVLVPFLLLGLENLLQLPLLLPLGFEAGVVLILVSDLVSAGCLTHFFLEGDILVEGFELLVEFLD